MSPKSVLTGVIIAVSSLAAASFVATASAATIDWTQWSSGTPGVPGTASGAAGSVGVSYGGEIQSLMFNYPSWQPSPPTFVGGTVGNPPTPPGGIIQLFGNTGLTDTITFSQAVTNPVMAIWSLGQGGDVASFDFNESVSIESGGPSDEYTGGPIYSCGINDICGAEGNGTIQFNGTFTSVSWTNPSYENWYGFTVGVTSTPLPSTWTMLIAGFIGLGFFAYRGSKNNGSATAAA
jgi:hypothetical protein